MIDLLPPSWIDLYKNNCLCYENSNLNYFNFFLSFEDALWCYLTTYPPSNHNLIIPNFFCSDVTNRLKERGFNIYYYQLDKDLSFNSDNFLKSISQLTIATIIIYYPMGKMESFPQITWFREVLGQRCLIVEDYADCILKEEKINLIDDEHIIIDSLRKVLPIQGARLFSLKKVTPKNFNFYKLKVFFLWFFFNLTSNLYKVTEISFFDDWRWKFFNLHSDTIGTHLQGTSGFWLDKFLLKFINFQAISKLKEKSVEKMIEGLSVINSSSQHIELIAIKKQEYKNLRFLVLRSEKNSLLSLCKQLEVQQIITDIHFEDSPLGKKYDFLLLPIPLNISDHYLSKLIKTITT